jgi:hypothetical protein
VNLRSTILAEHSKANCNKIVNWIGDSQKRFDELFELFLNDEYRVAQRAAWPLSNSVINHPKLISKHYHRLLKNLSKPGIHDSVRRNTVRLLQDVDIPKKFHGRVMDICFHYISSPQTSVAVKCFSLVVLENLTQQYPEIKNEIRMIIGEGWQKTAALRSRAKKFLQS